MAMPHSPARIPPLENGDHLTREEFERRWDLHPEIKKAELIDGMVFVQLTVHRRHSKPHSWINTWIGTYAAKHGDVEALSESTVRLGDADLQPDVLLRLLAGSSTVGEDDCIEGPPELVAEISASSVSYDLHRKRELCRRNGVREYLVWQVFENQIEWWELRDGDYVTIEPDAGGITESGVFPGLRLNRAAILAGDMAAVLAAL